MSATIRSAVADDLAAIVAIEQEAASAAHWTNDQYEVRIAKGLILVAGKVGCVLGFICARDVAGEWEIENIVVARQERRRGIARGMLQEFLRRARNQNGMVVRLEVRETNQAAQRLYLSAGFSEAGRRRGYYQNPIEDAVLYELSLTAG